MRYSRLRNPIKAPYNKESGASHRGRLLLYHIASIFDRIRLEIGGQLWNSARLRLA
jgi:hypothetical protein